MDDTRSATPLRTLGTMSTRRTTVRALAGLLGLALVDAAWTEGKRRQRQP